MKLKHFKTVVMASVALLGATLAGHAAGPYNGTIVGSPTYVTGKFGQALSVTGTSATQGVQLPEPGPADVASGTAWTIEGWFYLTSTPANGTYLFRQNRGPSNNVFLQFNGNGYLYLTAGVPGGGGAAGQSMFGGGMPSLNTWHHIAVVYANGSIAEFRDGIGGATTACTVASATSPTAYLGTDGTAAGTFTGLLDDWSFSSTAQYSGATYTVPTAALGAARSGQFALYHFDGNLSDSNLYGTIGFTLSPSLVVPGQNITETATGFGTAWTTSTTFSVSTPTTITGASISNIAVNAAAQTATFTLSPGSLAAGTSLAQETISNSADTGTAPVNLQPFGVGSLLPTAVTATSASLSLGAVVSGVTPYGYLTYRSTNGAFTPAPALLLPGESATPAASPLLSDTGLTSGTTYYYKVVASDSAGNAATTYEAAATTPAASILVVAVGDSISLGLFSTGWPANSYPYLLQQDLASQSSKTWTVLNEGYSSAKTSDWTPTSTTNPTGTGQARGGGANPGSVSTNIYNTMKAHITATGLTPSLFIYRLDTNDEGGATPYSVSAIYANTQAWLTQAEADYPTAKFIIEAPPYTVPGAYNGNWTEAGIANLSALQSEATYFVDNKRVFPGTTNAWTYFMNTLNYVVNNGVLDQVHPSNSGYAALAQMEVAPVLNALNPPVGTTSILYTGGQIKRGR